MSLTGSDFWSPGSTVLVTAKRETCFYCGELIEDPAVTWHGATSEIWLHPGCVMDLLLRLSRDVWQLQCSTGRRFGP